MLPAVLRRLEAGEVGNAHKHKHTYTQTQTRFTAVQVAKYLCGPAHASQLCIPPHIPCRSLVSTLVRSYVVFFVAQQQSLSHNWPTCGLGCTVLAYAAACALVLAEVLSSLPTCLVSLYLHIYGASLAL